MVSTPKHVYTINKHIFKNTKTAALKVLQTLGRTRHILEHARHRLIIHRFTNHKFTRNIFTTQVHKEHIHRAQVHKEHIQEAHNSIHTARNQFHLASQQVSVFSHSCLPQPLMPVSKVLAMPSQKSLSS